MDINNSSKSLGKNHKEIRIDGNKTTAKNHYSFLNAVMFPCSLAFIITEGIVNAATTPIIAKVIKTSAKVKPFFIF